MYLQTRGTSGVIYAKGVWQTDEERGWLGRVHRQTDVALGQGLRHREAAVVRGMVLGDSSRIPEELEEAFQRSGITHRSGYIRPTRSSLGGHDLPGTAPL